MIKPRREKKIKSLFLCALLSDFWLCYSCSGTLLHDSRSYSNLDLSLFVLVCFAFANVFFAVINRCQRIFYSCVFFVSFVHFIRLTAARSHSFANSLSTYLTLRLFLPFLRLFYSTFVFLRVSLCVSYRGGGGLLLFAIDCPIYILYTHLRAILIFTLNIFFARWVLCLALNWIVELILSESDVLILLFLLLFFCCISLYNKPNVSFVCTLDIIFLFFFFFLWFYKNLRFRYMIIVVCVCVVFQTEELKHTITSWRPVFVSWHLYTLMVSRLFQR